jgi:arylsulfatase A-like enzyme
MLAGLAVPAVAQRRPLNFVFFLIDDMGWRDCGTYGSRYYETPNIDRLAAEGMRFTNAYAACPVCSPTRAALLTGKYPARLRLTDWIPGRKQWPAARLLVPKFNQQLPLAERTIPELLKPAGYRAASIGKWHLGGDGFDPVMQGFDLNVAGTLRGSPPGYFGPAALPGLKSASGEYLTDRLAEEAERYIESNLSPFLLYLPHFAVHIPLQAKQQMIGKYRSKPDPQGDPVYAAMVESMDQAVGRVLTTLDRTGLADRTVVIFTSDNGGLRFEGRGKDPVTSNAPLRAGKGHIYEGGVRVPLIVRWAGVTKPGSLSDVPVCSIDFLPTITEAAGVRAPRVDGVSLVPALQGRSLKREALYWHYPHYSNQGGVPAGSVRSGDWKLVEFYEDGRLELFNLSSDPGEESNLAGREPKRTARMHEMLKRWRNSVDAEMPAPNPAYNPAQSDQGLTGVEPVAARL